MRCLLLFGLLLVSFASASATTRDPVRPPVRQHAQKHQLANPGAALPAQPRFAVPGWTDEDTERWLDNASSSWSQA
jgi:hypothetical protein